MPRLLPDRVSQATLVFALAMVCYTANGRTIGSGDTLPARYLPFAILHRGTFHLDDYPFLYRGKAYWVRRVGDHYVSFYPVGAAIAALPWYVPAIAAGAQAGERRSEDLEKLAAAGIVALSVAALFAALRRVTSRRGALWITVAYALGTSSLSVSSQGLWQHGPSQLAFSLALLFLVRARQGDAHWAGLAGLPLAFAVICRQTNLAISLPLACYVALVHRRQLLLFAAAAAPPVAFQLWYNVNYLGDPFWTQISLDAFHWRGRVRNTLPGLLVSPSRGLFVYSPVFAFSLVGIALACRRGGDGLVRAIALGWLLVLGVYSRWWVWWGGACYGPRMLADLTPLLAYAIHPSVGLLERVRAWRLVFAAALLWSVLAHSTGAYWYDGAWDGKLVGPDAGLYTRLWSWHDNPLLNSFREVSTNALSAFASSPASPDLARERALAAEIAASPDEDRPLLALRDLRAASGAAEDAARIEALRRSRFTPEHRLDWEFEDELVLLGIDWRAVDARHIEVTFYWRAERQLSEQYAAFATWSRAECGEKQDRILGSPGHPTTHWVAGQTFKQRHRLAVPEAAGDCALRVGVWSPRQRSRLYIRHWPVWKSSGDLLHVSAGRIEVVASGRDSLLVGP
jgi:hypothetical protein